jgi:hypothetical protein
MIQTTLAEHYPAKAKGHRWVDLRGVLHGFIFRLRTGGDLVGRNPTDRGKKG